MCTRFSNLIGSNLGEEVWSVQSGAYKGLHQSVGINSRQKWHLMWTQLQETEHCIAK